jgi:CRP-like cAMP-binding protein
LYELLSPALRIELMENLYSVPLKMCPIFNLEGISQGFLRSVYISLVSVVLPPATTVYHQDEIRTDVYVVISGELKRTFKDSAIHSLKRGDAFGQSGLAPKIGKDMTQTEVRVCVCVCV